MNSPEPTRHLPKSSNKSLSDLVAAGVSWGVGGALLYQLAALVVQTALTHFLDKAEYGTYAKAFSILTFATLLQHLGFNEILLRRRKRFRSWLSPIFWLALTMGVVGSLVLLAVAWPLSQLYDDPDLAKLLLLGAPLPIARSLTIIPSAVLVEAMRFRAHYGLMLLGGLGTSLLTLGLAMSGFGPSAFIVATLVAEQCALIGLWKLARIGPIAPYRPSRCRVILKDLRFVFGANFSRWLRAGTDPLVLGTFASSSTVGLYFFAQSLALQIPRVMSLNLAGALLPALNRLDGARQTEAFLQASRVVMLLGAPVCVGLAVISPLFVRVFLNIETWGELPAVLSVLALGTVFRLLEEPTNSLIAAQGRFRLRFRLSIVSAVIYLVALSLGAATARAEFAAAAGALFYVVFGPVLLWIACGANLASIHACVSMFLFPLTIALASIVPWISLHQLCPGTGLVRDACVLCATILGAAISYFWSLNVLRPAGWSELIKRAAAMAPGSLKYAVLRFG